MVFNSFDSSKNMLQQIYMCVFSCLFWSSDMICCIGACLRLFFYWVVTSIRKHDFTLKIIMVMNNVCLSCSCITFLSNFLNDWSLVYACLRRNAAEKCGMARGSSAIQRKSPAKYSSLLGYRKIHIFNKLE